MGVRIISSGSSACLYCSTSEIAFGPVFHEDKLGHDAESRLELFCEFLKQDARKLTDRELETALGQFYAVEKSLWDEKENPEVSDEEMWGYSEPSDD